MLINNLMNKYKSFPIQVRASFWFLICSFLQKGISSLTTPIFTRLLSTAEYGRFNVFNSWLGIITIFVSMNLYSGVYNQGLIKFDKERDAFSSSLQGLTLSMISVWTVIYLLFRSFWNAIFSLTTVQMLAMLLMIWSTAVFNFWAAEQRVKLSYGRLVTVTLLISIAKPVVGIVCVVNAEDKVTARILGLALVELIGYMGLFISQMIRGKKFFSAFFWKYALLFNLPLIPHYLSQTVLSSADRIMIDKMVGESEAGIYSLAYSVSMIMTLFNSALSQTIAPWMYQKIKDKKAKDIEPIAYISLAIVAGANLLLIAFAPEVISIFAPKSYYEAIWVIPPVAMSVYFIYLYDLFIRFELYYEKRSFVMTASVIAAVLNIILNYIFINIFGYIAAGYTTLICYIIYSLGHYIFMKRICKTCMNGERIYSPKVLLGITLLFIVSGSMFLFTYSFRILRYLLVGLWIVLAFIKRSVILEKIKAILGVKRGSDK